ncbi:MAG: preprotein translocase subunit SecA [Alphaproteobacteria bacterium]
MLGNVAKRIFGTSNDRYLKRLKSSIEVVNELEEEFEKLSDEELRKKTLEFKERLKEGETLDSLLPEAFATVREAAKRTLKQRHFDVQLIGGIVLHQGRIAEMRTGEGKTLVATLPVYLNALLGKGVHVVTVNDYLAKRDSEWMGRVYRFLGLTVGCIVHDLSDRERREAYACDVTYGTNNELGFDYLRDNMKFSKEDLVQRPFCYAIVDEVDSILIDEARTPLIISGHSEDSSERYISVNRIIPKLSKEHYDIDEKQRSVTLSESGLIKAEDLLKEAGLIKEGSMFDIQNVAIVHHVDQALKAHKIFTKDVDYIVKDNKVIIIDEFTGRMMEGRRYSDGLHQAIEAKEGVAVQSENQTLASITFQNFFRLYPKLSGMTGTAATEATEFSDIYSLEVVEIPTNLPCKRIDNNDEIYRTAEEKYDAIIDTISKCQKKGQPILVGTVSIEKSELIAELLRKKTNIKFEVLNARHHEREASIVAEAGVPGAVTIATNMAGRGTDIQLGGNLDMRIAQRLENVKDEALKEEIIKKTTEEIRDARQKALDAGGLFILGTERHESRRIDNQLRGRSGRQGDPGESKFYISLQDDLMRIFGSERMDTMLVKLGLKDGEAIIHPWINKAIEKAQEKVEDRNYDIRKNLLKYDDVMNDQRKVIYEQRLEIMTEQDVSETIVDMRQEWVDSLLETYCPVKTLSDQWDYEGLSKDIYHITGIEADVRKWVVDDSLSHYEVGDRLLKLIDNLMTKKEEKFSPEVMRMIEKSLLLQVVDSCWKEHLIALDAMRHTILLRAYGQKDPLNEYKKEAFELFGFMLDQIRERLINLLSRVEIRTGADFVPMPHDSEVEMNEIHENPAPLIGSGGSAPESGKHEPFKHEFDPKNPSTWSNIPRNAPCPCGSGKKFKHCHGRVA